jgi:glycosyltransferase involved in cell wall biosynthesis
MYPKKFGSIEEYCLFLTRELSSRGHSSLLAFPHPPFAALRDRLVEAGAEIVQLRIPHGPKETFQLWREIRKLDVDIVHGTFLPMFSILPIVFKLAGVPRVIFSDQISRSAAPRGRLQRNLSVLRTRLLSRWIDLIIADAAYVHDSVVNELGFPASKVMTLYNGVNPARFTPNQETSRSRKELGISETAGVVASVGQAIPEKALDIYLRAAKAVLQRNPDTVFLVVGDGPALPELRELATSLGISNSVIFTGLLTEVQHIFSVSDVLALVPRWREAFAFSMLETMASGKPLVASSIGAIPEAVIETGLLVPPEDPEATAGALLELLNDRAKARRLGSAARRRCEELYDVRDMVRKTVDVYSGVATPSSDRLAADARGSEEAPDEPASAHRAI